MYRHTSLNKNYRVGRLIGEGACGSVHTLDRRNTGGKTFAEDADFVVKLCPIPVSKKGKAGGKKRKKTAAERNADTLFHEYNLYRNALHDMRGGCVPDLPFGGNSPPCYGETDEFRYIVLERMACNISSGECIELLREDENAVGNLCVQMLSHLERLHEKCLLFVDVKPDNFMLVDIHSKAKGKAAADNVRLIDFGLVENYMDRSKHGHRDDVGGGLVGTPAYCSLNLHEGHTPSRRDDVESLGYVICKILVLLSNDCGMLPWETAKSDGEVGRIKKLHVYDARSAFYSKMSASSTNSKIMFDYFDICSKIGYTQSPNYDQLKGLLKKIVSIDGGSLDAKASSKRKQSKANRRKMPAKRLPAGTPERQKRSTRTAKTVIEIFSSDDEFLSAQEEEIEDDVKENSINSTRKTKTQAQASAKLLITGGPHEGEVFEVVQDECDELVIGRKPSQERKKTRSKIILYWALSKDESISSLHASLKLSVSKYSSAAVSFSIADLDSTNGVLVNDRFISKPRQIFPGDRVKLGSTQLEFRRG